MTPNEIQNIRRLKSKPRKMSSSELDIDAEAGIIRNVIMCSVGEAKGHGFWLEQEFIDDLVAYDKRYFTKIGLKSRFDHPAMCDGTMGTQLGIFKDFKVVGEDAVADLYLLSSSNLSPTHPGMREWILSMATERPDFIMSSIVFKPGRYYQRDSGGAKLYVYEYDKEDQYIYPNSQLGHVFVEFGKDGEHFYTDIVEAGATTDTLYSAQFNPQSFAVRAVEWLNDNPEIREFAQNNPDALADFFSKSGIEFYKPKPQKRMKNLRQMFAEFLGANGDGGDEDIFKKNLAEVESKLTSLTEKNTALETELAAANTANESLTSANADLTAQLAARDARIVELEGAPAAEHTEGSTESTPPAETRKMSEATARAVELLGRKPKA